MEQDIDKKTDHFSEIHQIPQNVLSRLIPKWVGCDEILFASRNRFRVRRGDLEFMIYVSQTKPSAYGRANWYYEFFNSIAKNAMDEIFSNEATLLLIDYASHRYVVLNQDDISWAHENSSRMRKKQGLVTDFVIREFEGVFYLVPILANTGLFRKVEVVKFQ